MNNIYVVPTLAELERKERLLIQCVTMTDSILYSVRRMNRLILPHHMQAERDNIETEVVEFQDSITTCSDRILVFLGAHRGERLVTLEEVDATYMEIDRIVQGARQALFNATALHAAIYI